MRYVYHPAPLLAFLEKHRDPTNEDQELLIVRLQSTLDLNQFVILTEDEQALVDRLQIEHPPEETPNDHPTTP